MKRKILLSVMLCAFAGLTLLNLGLARQTGETDTTLDLISVMAKAYDEGEEEGKPRIYVKEWLGPYYCNDAPETQVFCRNCKEGGEERCTQTCPPCSDPS